MIELKLLGYPRILVDGEVVENFMSSKVIVLLCYMALNPHTHARERLAGLFWGDMPDSNAKSNLRQALHDLGKRLGDDYVDVTRQTARFRAEQPHTIDALTLNEVTQNPDAELSDIESAVNDYRGMFLEGIILDTDDELEDWLRTQREQSRLAYIDALDRLGNAYLQQRNWQKAESILRRLIAVEPLREATHRQLMLVYARQGKYDAALAQYEDCVQILADELDVEPIRETTALYAAIQQARTLPRHNLPPLTGAFIGREVELNALSNWLYDPRIRLINILGPGGTGKSRLAAQLASLHTHHFLHGVRYLSLVPLTQAGQFAPALAQMLDISLTAAPAPLHQITAHIKDQELLLVLDNAEHIPDIAGALDTLLQETTTLKIIITSRIRFNLQQEHVFSLGGLGTPEADVDQPEALQNYESVQFYLQTAQQHSRNLSLENHARAIGRFCRLVDGMPLAIEIGTALLPVISCEQLTQEIEQDFDLLDTPLQNVPERHRSLRAVFDHSWRLLSDDEQTVLARLSVFRGMFSLDAARQITATTVPILHKLVSQSLIRVYPDENGETRYDIHIAITQYAFEQLESNPDALNDVLDNHIAYYVQVTDESNRIMTGGRNRSANLASALTVMESKLSNIRIAWQYALERGNLQALREMSAPMHRFYEGTNRFLEGSEFFESVLAQLDCDDCTPEQALTFSKVGIHCAGLLLRLGALERVRELAEYGERVFSEQAQLDDLGFTLNILGIVQLYSGQFDDAKTTLMRCANTYRELNNQAELLKPLANLGSLSSRTGDYQTAETVLNEGVIISEKLGDQRGLCYFLANLGAVKQGAGDYESAMHYYERVLLLSDAMANLHVKGVTLMNMGEMKVKQGNFEPALDSLKAGIQVMQEIKDYRNLSAGFMWLGLAYCGLKEIEPAISQLILALETARQTEAPPAILGVLIGIAKFYVDTNRQERGASLLDYTIEHRATEHGFREYATSIRQRLSIPAESRPRSDDALDTIVIEYMSELKALME